MEESLTMFEFNFVKKVQFCQKVKQKCYKRNHARRPHHKYKLGINRNNYIFPGNFPLLSSMPDYALYIFRGNTVIKKKKKQLRLQNAVTQETGTKLDFFQ